MILDNPSFIADFTIQVAELQWKWSGIGGNIHYIVMGLQDEEWRQASDVWLQLLEEAGRNHRARGI